MFPEAHRLTRFNQKYDYTGRLTAVKEKLVVKQGPPTLNVVS